MTGAILKSAVLWLEINRCGIACVPASILTSRLRTMVFDHTLKYLFLTNIAVCNHNLCYHIEIMFYIVITLSDFY